MADAVRSVSEQPSFLDEVQPRTPGESRLLKCIQCGTCGGSCPSGADMQYTPRHIFAMIRADMRDEVLSSNTPWYCVSCYYCTVRCPQDVHITDIMYTLKRMAIEVNTTMIQPRLTSPRCSSTGSRTTAARSSWV